MSTTTNNENQQQQQQQQSSSSPDNAFPEQFSSANIDGDGDIARMRRGSVASTVLSPASPGADSHATESPSSPPGPLPPGGAAVVVKMNDPEMAKLFCDNEITTSKFTILNFLVYDLLLQFRQISNVYFLIVMIFSLVPTVSPFIPIISIAPLLFVVGVAMIKDGYEDFIRHRNDARANSQIAHVVRKNKEAGGEYVLTDVESADVRVGDIMQIKSGEEIRADVLLLSSSGVESSAFIETCNLDGETNLKARKAVPETWKINSVEAAIAASVEVRTTEPSPHLHHWGGVVIVDGVEAAVGIDQFLYRSSVLKNTEEAWGLVLYAGVDTKMFRNLEERPPKMSGLDIKLNWLIATVTTIQNVLLFFQAGFAAWWRDNEADSRHWYMQAYTSRRSSGETFGYSYLTYFILMSYMVPISVFVTIELNKVAQATWMQLDHGMFEWMNDKWQHCVANTSNLNEQLAIVKFIFSDKTGTLTENVMKFKLGDALGLPVDSDNWSTSMDHMGDERMQRYMRALSLCHTVQPFPDASAPGGYKYDGESPDELALVETAREHGVELLDRFVRTIHLRNTGTGETAEWEILATLKFTPDRKMMSIVVRNPVTGKIEIYTKGADSFVKDRLATAANAPYIDTTQERLNVMAGTGLRTLMVCYREVPEAEFEEWQQKFIEAGKALDNRSQLVDAVCLDLEKELIMVGITAIEDKLQDQVPETIQFFLDAGIVVWMLTGDKRETAQTIAATSSLTNPEKDVIAHIDVHHRKSSDPECVGIVQEQLELVRGFLDRIAMDKTEQRVSFIIDGPALTVAMDHLPKLFIEVSQRVSSAVCCRLTPLQKAKVVAMFQQQTGETALAIGDGANDVSMIGEGKVGVGIVGLEGAQAALAADYAIPRFKHLKRLLAVHGRYALVRNALCIIFSFYKNFTMATTLALYSFHEGFSGSALYDGWLLTFFNIVFTSIPPFFVGVFEKDCPEEQLMRDPSLYRDLSKGTYFGWRELTLWFGEAVVHGICIFYINYPLLTAFDKKDGKEADVVTTSSSINAMIIALVLFKLVIHIRYFTWVVVAGFGACLIIYFLFIVAQSGLSPIDNPLFALDALMWTEPQYWAVVCFGCFGLTMLDLFGVTFWRYMWPSGIDRALMPLSGADADDEEMKERHPLSSPEDRRSNSSAPFHPEDGTGRSDFSGKSPGSNSNNGGAADGGALVGLPVAAAAAAATRGEDDHADAQHHHQ